MPSIRVRPRAAERIASMKKKIQRTAEGRPALDGGDGSSKALSCKEREVMRCFASGMTSNATSAELGVSPHTVDTYARRIYAKFGVHSRAAAVAIFVQSNARLPPAV